MKWVHGNVGTREKKEKEDIEPAHNKLDKLLIWVSQATGDTSKIRHLKSSKAVKILGFFTRPNGDCSSHTI